MAGVRYIVAVLCSLLLVGVASGSGKHARHRVRKHRHKQRHQAEPEEEGSSSAAGSVDGLQMKEATEEQECDIKFSMCVPSWDDSNFLGDHPTCGDIKKMMTKAEGGTGSGHPAAPAILIVPQNDYMYSGALQARGYASVRGGEFDLIVVVGYYQSVKFEKVIVDDCKTALMNNKAVSFVKSKLGQFAGYRCETEVGAAFVASGNETLNDYEEAAKGFCLDSSLEMQMPFIQYTFPGKKIVPIMLGSNSEFLAAKVASALNELAKQEKFKKTLFIFSTDLSQHFGHHDTAMMDNEVVEVMTVGEVEDLDELMRQRQQVDQARGDDGRLATPPGSGLLLAAKRLAMWLNLRGRELVMGNSGDVTGDDSDVVGFASLLYSHASYP